MLDSVCPRRQKMDYVFAASAARAARFCTFCAGPNGIKRGVNLHETQKIIRFLRGRHFFIDLATKRFFDTLQGSIWAPFWSNFVGPGLVSGVQERLWGDF